MRTYSHIPTERSRARPEPARQTNHIGATSAPHLDDSVRLLQHLQRTVGNAAVNQLLRQHMTARYARDLPADGPTAVEAARTPSSREVTPGQEGAAARIVWPSAAATTPAAPTIPIQRQASGTAALVQRVRTKPKVALRGKERTRRGWKKTKLWPEQALKGRILERTDKYIIRTKGGGYIDMNKVKSSFPAIDGIANGQFRQIKAYLAIGDDKKKARANAVARIVGQVAELEEKCEIAAKQLTANNGRLLSLLLEINKGKRSTKGRTGKAPYEEQSTSKARRERHQGVLPTSFRDEATSQLATFKKSGDWDEDALAQEMLKNMVIVVPDDLVAPVQKELKSMDVEGGGLTSQQIKTMMDEIGYAQSKARGEEVDEDYVDS